MSDFSDYSYLTPPADPSELDAWLAEHEERIASKTRSTLTRIIVEATEQFINSLTATGDMSYFDQIPAQWINFVDTELVEDMQGIFLSGGMGAWSTSKSSGLFTEKLADGWVSIVNQQSVDYALEATNRMKDVGMTAWNDIKSKVSQSIEQGTSREKLADLLRQTQNFSRYRAETVARTEAANAYNNGDWAGQQALGEYGPTYKYWVATLDPPRARDEHMAINKKTVPINQPFLVGGEEMMFPHSPGASAKNVVNCRCRALYLYPGDVNPETGEIIGEEVLAEKSAPQTQATKVSKKTASVKSSTGKAPKFKTTKDAEDWLQQRHGVTASGKLRTIKLGQIAVEAAQMIAEDMDYLFTKYPKVANDLTKFGSAQAHGFPIAPNMNGLASYAQEFLYYDEIIYSQSGWQSLVAQAKELGWASSAYPIRTVHHEFGHWVHYSIEKLSGSFIGTAYAETYLKEQVAQIIKTASGSTAKASLSYSSARVTKLVEANISAYGSTNVKEAIAEAFAESMLADLSAGQVRPYAAAIREWMDAEVANIWW